MNMYDFDIDHLEQLPPETEVDLTPGTVVVIVGLVVAAFGLVTRALSYK